MGPSPQATRDDDYWRLHRLSDGITAHDLRSKTRTAGYPITHLTSQEQVAGYGARIQRSELCYHTCSNEELRQFAADRKLADPRDWRRNGRYWRPRWIEGLTLADEERRFDFLGLPPELRVQIYELYISGVSQELHCPTQPPLSRTCRIVRKEALPIFYSELTIDVRFDTYSSCGTSYLEVSDETLSWFARMSHEVWCMLKELRISRYESQIDEWLHDVRVSFRKEEPGYEVAVGGLDYAPENFRQQDLAVFRALKDKLVVLMQELVARGDRDGFGLDEVFALRAVVQKGYL